MRANGVFLSTYLIKSDQLDNCHLGGVAATRAGLVDAGVAAVAVSILGADLINDLLGNVLLGDVGDCLLYTSDAADE